MQHHAYRSIYRAGLFDRHVVVITGGGSGIGRCTAHELGALGASIALVGRNEVKLKQVQSELLNTGTNAAYYLCDIRMEDSVRDVVSRVVTRFGRLDHLVNNAGGQFTSPLETISKKGWEAVVSCNLTGGFLMARECYTQWMRENGGSIVNMAADMWNGMPQMGHSGAARAGMVNFTMTAALEWGVANVRVNAVAPGLVASSGLSKYPQEVRDEALLLVAKNTPLGRAGTEAEVASVITFLLSDGAAFISGTTISIDGGFAVATPNYLLPPRLKPSMAYEGFEPVVNQEQVVDE